MPRFLPLILSLSLVAVMVPASHAAAAPTCALDGGTGTLEVAISDQGPAVFTRHLDAVWLDGAPCDTATVTNTDLIHVAASTSTTIVIDLTGGPFAPGISVEGDSASEIEFFLESSNDDPLSVQVVGTDGPDRFVVGQTNVGVLGADVVDLDGLDALADPDIYSQSGTWNDVRLEGGQGGDDLRGYLPRNVVEALPAYMDVVVDAGTGDDTVGWWAGGGSVDAGDGADTLDQTGVLDDMVVELPASAMGIAGEGIPLHSVEHVVGGSDGDLIIGASTGSHLRGGPGNDFLVGGSNADTLEGDAGNDQIMGLGGDDDLNGGGDLEDVVFYSEAPNGVIVDLGAGIAAGEGNDVIDGFTGVLGSPFSDLLIGSPGGDQLRGSSGDDLLRGRAGLDELYGERGGDALFGGNGNDGLVGGTGNDTLDGLRGEDTCNGGPGDHDRWVRCEHLYGLPRAAYRILARRSFGQ
jgi:Ca2+-binding RTX toxin-like protein